MGDGTTVDLVVKDNYHLMCLLHVLQHRLKMKKGEEESGCLRRFKLLKIKMKLSYKCRKEKYEMSDLFYAALIRSL